MATVAATATALTLLGSAPAWSHVTVSSPDAAAGGFGKLTFRVPSESDTASTVKVSVTLPTDTPFAFVSSQVKPGWKVSRTTTKLSPPVETGDFTISQAVTTVTWTADRQAKIRPGEFDEFSLSVGPFPDATGHEASEPIEFPVEQTYSDGEAVAWDQPAPADGSEAEHPAPTLTLAPAAGHDEETDVDTAPDEAAAEAEASASDSSNHADTSDDTARALGGGGLALGAVAALLAALAVRRPRRAS